MKKKTTLSIATGAAFAATVAMAPIAHAADNPFGMTKLDSGYQLAAADEKKMEGKCGEAKCGADKGKKKEGSCGGDKAKTKDGSCGGDKKKEGSCGGDKKKDGSCGGKK